MLAPSRPNCNKLPQKQSIGKADERRFAHLLLFMLYHLVLQEWLWQEFFMGQEPQLQPQEDLPRFFCFIRCITMAAITAASITIAIMFPMFSLIQLNMVKFLLLTYYIISFFLYGFALSFAASL